MKRNRENQTVVRGIMAAVLVAIVVSVAYADGRNHNPLVLPPDAHAYGKTYSEWSAAWWQWALALPVEGHPFIDSPDFQCDAGQSGPVWFLAAPFGTVERTCTIPVGKAVFLALLNAEASDLEGLGTTEEEQRATADFFADHIRDLFCTLDGVSINNLSDYRVLSPQFTFSAPTPWIFGATGGSGTSVSDGYFLLLTPFSKGAHTLHYGGSFHFSIAEGDPFDFDASIDITYHLTVEP